MQDPMPVLVVVVFTLAMVAVEAQAALGMTATIQATAMAQPSSSPSDTLYIPKIIHQSYLPDEATLDRMSTAPRSHFRRDWRRSCQVHNPGYQYMFWNESQAQDFVKQHYPDMLPYYNAVSKFVLKSDILRVMILDKLGGVWLDIDTECFAPVEPILKGFHLVAQAEWSFQLCNSHVAGVPGHPVWRQLMDWFIDKVKANVTDPLKHTGPVALTTVVKNHIQPTNLPRNMSLIVGAWADPLYPGSPGFRAYGLQEAWYLPCKWAKSYMSPCQSQLARSKAIVRQLANGVNVSLELVASTPDLPQAVKDVVEAAKTFRHIRGSHEYANSWTRWAYSDGLKALVRSQEALLGLQPFFSTAGLFEEYPQWVQGGCGESEEDKEALRKFQICPAVLRRAAAAGKCTVVSVRGRHDQLGANVSQPLHMESYIAQTYDCDVRVVTLQPRRQAEVLGRMTLTSEPMQLGPVYDQYSHPPTFTLPGFLRQHVAAPNNVTLLHIDCGQDCRVWEVLNQLQLTGSLELRRVGSLLVDLSVLSPRRRHMLNTVYQHLYQEVGFVGYSWGRSQMPGPVRRIPLLGGWGAAAGAGTQEQQRKLQADSGNEVADRQQPDAGGEIQQGGGQREQVQDAGGRTEGFAGFRQDDSRGRMTAVQSMAERPGGRSLQAQRKKSKRKHSRRGRGTEDGSGRELLQQLGRPSEFHLPPLRLGFARVL